MSEDKVPTKFAELYTDLEVTKAANHMLYEHLMSGVRDLLPHIHAQDIEDALGMTCVSLRHMPTETLLVIHEFLSNCSSIASRRKSE